LRATARTARLRVLPRREPRISGSEPRAAPRAWADHGRVFRTLTFWLRPVFALRVVTRFQKVAGFDRAIALASSALTAVVPLAIVTGAVLSKLGGKDIDDRIVDRYELSGAGADAVHAIFSPAGGQSTSVGILGVFLLLITVLSFTRAMQRLFEQTWELPPLSVRNTINGLRFVGGLIVFVAATGAVHALLGRGKLELVAALVVAPMSAAFYVWSGVTLSAKRLASRDLLPFAIVAAVLGAIYSVGNAVYLPHLFSSYADRYGAIGAVFAMISTLFCGMVILVAAAAAGREVTDELNRVRRGERPADDEIRKEWDEAVALVRSRFDAARGRVDDAAGRQEGPTAD
jgi:membrane protein